MMGKGFSLLIVSHDNKVSLNKYLSPFVIKLLIGLSIIIVAAIIFFGISYAPVYYRALQVEYFARRNQEIEEDFKLLNELKSELAVVRKENTKIRQLLGVSQAPQSIDLDNIGTTYNPASYNGSTAPDGSNKNVPAIVPTIGMISHDYSLDHRAIDIAAPLGAIVVAPAAGVVEKVGWDSIYGNYIYIKHNNVYTTFYGHLNTVAVAKDQPVLANDIIGHVGSSGRSTSPHLHYVLYFKGEEIDPKAYIK